MTQQRAARRLAGAEDDSRAAFEIDSKLGAQKEERALGSLRDDLALRAFARQLVDLVGPEDGYCTLTWRGRVVGCSLSNGRTEGHAAGEDSIRSAIQAAIASTTETGL